LPTGISPQINEAMSCEDQLVDPVATMHDEMSVMKDHICGLEDTLEAKVDRIRETMVLTEQVGGCQVAL
jgi:hypothetical protein